MATALPGGAHVALTGRREGDLRPETLGGERRSESVRRKIADREWCFVHQVHGRRVVEAHPGRPPEDGDALVTGEPDLVLAVLGADCALVGLASEEGVIAAVHAGWRGLVAGVIEEAAAAMRRHGATSIEAVLSACIHPECYQFSPADLDRVAAALGDGVRARTADGSPALDLPTAVRGELLRAGVRLAFEVGSCTGCSEGFFSARNKDDEARQLLAIWRDER